MVDDVIFTSRQVELLLYGDYRKGTKINLYTDSESTLQSIASSWQIEWKKWRITVRDLKDPLQDKEINSYQWLPTYNMWANVLTKEIKMASGFKSLLLDNVLYLPDEKTNLVQSVIIG